MRNEKQYVLFVNGLEKEVKEQDLYKLFQEYPVAYIKIPKDQTTKESLGYAFVGVKSQKADEIVEKYNYTKIPGFKKTIRICWYNVDRSGIKGKDNCNVFVKKLSKEVTHRELHEYFGQFGQIASLKLSEDEEGESLGFGFILFETEEEAEKAIKATNGVEFHGKKLFTGKFIKGKPKKPLTYNNIFVKNIPKDFTKDKVLSFFSKYGELGSCLINDVKTNLDSKIPEEKRQHILNHKSGFICFKSEKNAMKAVEELSYLKLSDNKYNEVLKKIADIVTTKGVISVEKRFEFGVFCIENYKDEALNRVNNSYTDTCAEYEEVVKEYEGIYLIKDNTDRFICCQALKKKEREKKLKAQYEKIKKQMKEKYKLCNLYVKNLPDNFDDNSLRELFQEFGKVKSVKTIKKELVNSYLGIKRSVRVFGYVCFEDKESAHNAKLGLNEKQLQTGSNRLYVNYHQTKQERNEFLKLSMINKTNKIGKGKGGENGPFGMRGVPQSKKYFYSLVRTFPNMMNVNSHMLRRPNNPMDMMDPHMFQTMQMNQMHMNNFNPMNMHQNMNEMMMMNMNMGGMNPMMHPQFNNNMNMGMMNPMMMNPFGDFSPEIENDNNLKREYYGEKLYAKISSNPTYQSINELFQKIVGIFLDLDEGIIRRLIADDLYFDAQVRDTVRLLAESNNN